MVGGSFRCAQRPGYKAMEFMTEDKQLQATIESREEPKAEENPLPPFTMKVILGQKVGMTQIFNEKGERIPVTVIYAGNCRSTDVKTVERDGYSAVQLGYGEKNEKKLTLPYKGIFAPKKLKPAYWVKEFRVADPKPFQVGQKVPVSVFSAGDYVDVSGTSKGKGFAGVMKRHGFSGLPASHGASDKERSGGSSGGGSGQGQRVLKGTRMAGHAGAEWVTTQKLEVVKVDPEQEILVLQGAVPGVSRGYVVVKETIKVKKHSFAVQEKLKSAKKGGKK